MLPFPLNKGSIPASALASFCKHRIILALALTCPCTPPSPPCSPSASPPSHLPTFSPSHLLPAVNHAICGPQLVPLFPPTFSCPLPHSASSSLSRLLARFMLPCLCTCSFLHLYVCMCLCVSAFCVSHKKHKERTIPVEKEREKKETCTSARDTDACLTEKFCHTSSSVSSLTFRLLHLCICVLSVCACVCVCVRACDSGTASECQRRCFLLATRS
jgi:hypothetical protein